MIAIDGYSSCGKSTMAKELARKVGYIYVDTGAMYRAVTLFAMRGGMIGSDGTVNADELESHLADISVTFRRDETTGRPLTCLNGEDVEREIRLMEVSHNVSAVAALPFVREALVRQQQEMGKAKGIVMDGRDIGTVVFPDAELKIFVTATAEVRAQRRYDELTAKGVKADLAEILNNVKSRDYADSHRAVSPLRQADDAVVLDNSHMSIAQQDEWLMAKFNERTAE